MSEIVYQDELTNRLLNCYSGAIYDTLRELGHSNQVLPYGIKSLNPSHKLAGKVFTMSGSKKEITADESMLRWTEFLSVATPGSVVICQPNDDSLSHTGELSSEVMKFRGIRGYIVDGGCRDTDFIVRMGFPVFCKYATPKDIVARWSPDSFNSTIRIGEVDINEGDYVIADQDGIVIIPADITSPVLDMTEEIMQTENLVRKAILQGMGPKDAYLKYRKF